MKQITCPHCADTYPDFDVAHVCSKGPYAPKLKPRMNERIKQLADQAQQYAEYNTPQGLEWLPMFKERFAELIVEECRNVVNDVYRKTPLELCGLLLTTDEEIAKHFYGVKR